MEAAKKVAIDVLQFISIQVKMLQMGQSIKGILLDLTDLVALQVKCLQLGIQLKTLGPQLPESIVLKSRLVSAPKGSLDQDRRVLRLLWQRERDCSLLRPLSEKSSKSLNPLYCSSR